MRPHTLTELLLIVKAAPERYTVGNSFHALCHVVLLLNLMPRVRNANTRRKRLNQNHKHGNALRPRISRHPEPRLILAE